ncbi:extracellular solute-binding protein [Saccharibacillus kuerlensis]|uniref:Sugar ABC transporter substrate-binding protein n=1 Tax=Saccharibacillus kuerlensis TaxID=459527 RepID=A0ABQ2KW14_9BACL|nr:extracellular solute-binding protein [Saccharibacillus kuerlensis]GGN94151.1 sugar ABC transporter substrate-binding protein [Saccharibacillus kuerlensis]
MRRLNFWYGKRTPLWLVPVLTGGVLALGLWLTNGYESGYETPAAAEEAISIEFWTPFSGGDSSFMNALVAQYNEENEDGVTVRMTNNKLDDYYMKLSTAIVTGEAPDVAIVHASKYAQYVPAEFVTAIGAEEAVQAEVDWTSFNPNILDKTVLDDVHYGLPLDAHFGVLYYNKKWLREAGLYKNGKVVIGPGEEGFTEFLKKIRDDVPENIAPLAVPSIRIDSLWLWWSLYSQIDGGGQLYTADGRAKLNMEAARKSLNYVDSLYREGLIPPDINDATSEFARGEAATLFLGVWSIGLFEQAEDLDFGVMPLPQIYDHPASWGDAHTLALPAQAEENPVKRQAALRFADWLTRRGDMWAQAGHIPAYEAAAHSEDFLLLPHRSDYADAADDVAYFPDHPKQGRVSDELVGELERLWSGSQTVEDMLQGIEPKIDRILGE